MNKTQSLKARFRFDVIVEFIFQYIPVIQDWNVIV